MNNRDIGQSLWPDAARRLLLHVHGQEIPHGDAKLHGSRDALRRLANACERAACARQGDPPEAVEMMAADGDHYILLIQPMSDEQMDRDGSHYAKPEPRDDKA